MKFFKHYTNAQKGETLQRLMATYGKAKGYGLYWLVVAYFADKWDGIAEPSFVVSKNELSSLLGLKQNKLISFLECFKNETITFSNENEKLLRVDFPKLLEVKHKDALPSKSRPASGPPKSRLYKEEDKYKEGRGRNSKPQTRGALPEFQSNEVVTTLLANVSQSAQQAWINAYSDSAWIVQEILKANAWMQANPKKAPKNYGRFITNWLSRGYEHQRKSIASNKPQTSQPKIIGGW